MCKSLIWAGRYLFLPKRPFRLCIGCGISIYKSVTGDLTEAQVYEQTRLQVFTCSKQHPGITEAGKALSLQNKDSWSSSPSQLSPVSLPFPPLMITLHELCGASSKSPQLLSILGEFFQLSKTSTHPPSPQTS